MLLGDALWEIAGRYAQLTNRTEFAQTLRSLSLTLSRYLGYISAMYPIVVGFNRALIRSISKVDHVRQCEFVKALAEQLQEEQWHNQLWRDHLLSVAMNGHAQSPYVGGQCMLVRHPGDDECEAIVRGYEVLLKEGDESFVDMPLDRLVATALP